MLRIEVDTSEDGDSVSVLGKTVRNRVGQVVTYLMAYGRTPLSDAANLG